MDAIKPWTKVAQNAATKKGIGELAKAVKYNRSHISQCIHGKRKTSPFLAIALGEALGLPVAHFGQKRGKA